MTIGEWLNKAIMNAAKQSVQGDEADAAMPQLPSLPISELARAIEKLSEDIRLQNERRSEGVTVDRAAIEESVAPVVEKTVAPVAASVKKLEEEFEAKLEALQLGEPSGQMQSRVQEAEAKAERASLALAPLERKIMRMAMELEKQKHDEHDERHEPERRGLLSRMFGG